jgi:hypothetical protein
VLFGNGASLNIPGSFVATTANNIRMGNAFFSATGPIGSIIDNDFAALSAAPDAFVFTAQNPGAVVNLGGNLSLGAARAGAPVSRTLVLAGGTVLSSSDITSPGSNVIIASTGANQAGQAAFLQLSQPGSLVTLNVPSQSFSFSGAGLQPLPGTFNVPNIAQLVFGGLNVGNATGIQVQGGNVVLTGSGLTVNNGDLAAQNINISANPAATVNGAGNVIRLISVGASGNLLTGNLRNSVAANSNLTIGGTIELISNGGSIRTGDVNGGAISLQGQSGLQSGAIVTNGRFANGGPFSFGGQNFVINLSTNQGNLGVRTIQANGPGASGTAATNSNIRINVPGGVFQASGIVDNNGLAGDARTIPVSVSSRGNIVISQNGNFVQGANGTGSLILRLADGQQVFIRSVLANGSLELVNGAGQVVTGNVIATRVINGATTGSSGSSSGLIVTSGVNGDVTGVGGVTPAAGSTNRIQIATGSGTVNAGNLIVSAGGGTTGGGTVNGNNNGTTTDEQAARVGTLDTEENRAQKQTDRLHQGNLEVQPQSSTGELLTVQPQEVAQGRVEIDRPVAAPEITTPQTVVPEVTQPLQIEQPKKNVAAKKKKKVAIPQLW